MSLVRMLAYTKMRNDSTRGPRGSIMQPQGVSRVAPIYYRDEIRMVMPIDAFAAGITSGP